MGTEPGADRDDFKHYLRVYCHTESLELIEDLKKLVESGRQAERIESFRNRLRSYVSERSMAPDELERLTGAYFETREEVAEWLRQLYDKLFMS